MHKKTLLVSRHINLLPWYKSEFQKMGFTDVQTTNKEKDALNMLIKEIKPKRIYIASNFYDIATPYMVGVFHEKWKGKKIKINVVNIDEFPDELAIWFIFHGAVSYIDLTDGIEEFKNGIKKSLDAEIYDEYMSRGVKYIYDHMDDRPECNLTVTEKHKEILFMLCNGRTREEMTKNLDVCQATVSYHLRELLSMFHVHKKEELIKIAHILGIVNDNLLKVSKCKKHNAALPDFAKRQLEINRSAYDYKNKKRTA